MLIPRCKLLVVPPTPNDFSSVGGCSVRTIWAWKCVCVRLCANVLVTFPFKASLTASAFIISPLINTEKLLTQRKREAEIKNERREREMHSEREKAWEAWRDSSFHLLQSLHPYKEPRTPRSHSHIDPRAETLWTHLWTGASFRDLNLSSADYTTHARAAFKLAYFDCILKLNISIPLRQYWDILQQDCNHIFRI